MAPKTTIGDVLTTNKTCKEGGGHQTPCEKLNTFKRDDNMQLTRYGERERTLKREKVTKPTLEGDNSITASYTEDDKIPYGYSGITLNRDGRKYSTPVEDLLSMHGPRNKGPMSLTLNGGK